MSRGTTRCKCPLTFTQDRCPRRSGANRHDSLFVEPILDGMPAIKRGGRGHQRRRPVKPHADKGYDIPRVRRYLRHHGITPPIAGIGVDSSARLGRHRWVVERTLGWPPSYDACLRYDRTTATITALARLAVTLLCADGYQRTNATTYVKASWRP